MTALELAEAQLAETIDREILPCATVRVAALLQRDAWRAAWRAEHAKVDELQTRIEALEFELNNYRKAPSVGDCPIFQGQNP